MTDFNAFHGISFEKVPSPTGSDDSGLGLSPRSTNSDLRLYVESPEVHSDGSSLSYFFGTDVKEELRTSRDTFAIPFEETARDSSFNQPMQPSVSQPSLDSGSLEAILSSLGSSSIEQTNHISKNKLSSSNKLTKKRPSANDPKCLTLKLKHCLTPKTGNGKPRRTSLKRKTKKTKDNKTSINPGVRKTVKERLAEIREREASQSNSKDIPATQQPALSSLVQISQSVTSPSTNICSPLPSTIPYTPTSPQTSSSIMAATPEPPTSGSVSDDLRWEDSFSDNIFEPEGYFEPSLSPILHQDLYHPDPLVTSTSNSSYTDTNPNFFFSQHMNHETINLSSPLNPTYQTSTSENVVSSFPCMTAISSTSSTPYSQTLYSTPTSFATNYGIKPTGTTSSLPQQPPLQTSENNNYFDEMSLLDCISRGDLHRLYCKLSNGSILIDGTYGDDLTPLMYAVKTNRGEAASILLRCGANPRALTHNNSNIFHLASPHPVNLMTLLMNNLEQSLVKSLIDARSGDRGRTPLQMATEAGNVDAMLLLLRNGASVTSQENGTGLTCLHIAIKKGHVAAVETLLGFVAGNSHSYDTARLKAVVNQETYDQNTALHFAAAELNKSTPCQTSSDLVAHIQHQIIDLLLRHHANPSVKNMNNQLPLQLLPRGRTQLHERLRPVHFRPFRTLDFQAPPLRQHVRRDSFYEPKGSF